MATITYTLSKVRMGDLAEVRVRFSAGRGYDRQCLTHIYAPVCAWNKEDGRLSVPKRIVTAEHRHCAYINTQLDMLRGYLMDEFVATNHHPAEWLTNTIDAYMGRGNKTGSVDIVEAIAAYPVENNLSANTTKVYRMIAHALDGYAGVRNATSMSVADMQELLAYIGRGRSHNTMVTITKNIRAVFNWLVRRGMISKSPMSAISKGKTIDGDVIFLTIAERNKIITTPMPTKQMERQRDIFIFQCCVGCRVSDLITLRPANITGSDMVSYIAHKTRNDNGEVISVPLSPLAKVIVEKYRGHQIDGRLLPFISKQRYNLYIKEVLRVAGIDRMVMDQDPLTLEERQRPLCDIAASHLARKTFTANTFAAVMDTRLVASLTGHSPSSTSFLRYTSVTDEMKRKMVEMTEGDNPNIIPTSLSDNFR